MMQSMGFKAEEGLGKHDSQPMLEPLTLERKNDKSGLGHVNERKRLLEELLVEEQQQSKKQVVEIETFEKHQRQVYSEKQTAKYLRGALSVLERLEEDKLEAQGKPLNETDCHPFLKTMIETRKAAEEERRKRIRRMNGLQSNSDSDDELSSQSPQYLSEDVPTSDDETPDTSVSKSPRTEFDTAEDSMKLNMLLNELRTKYLYCFWCGSKYTDKSDLEMNCPGLDEESH
ncbi:RNA-binding protein [Schizosaccharomyces japonicus yFS275]|uniref:RNA-binding protein n=1 Tax=Schizosaccharomyces japonicus (strain yFS275 / FY16936) TaxID=402676 RepID=B6JXR9_SCHJY|nr:RNA-binding protein [Schizosaccharomyces japonicus yFS275]EEB06337.1 RNA-binding protein [Schizosaccharomyces japonicus yFS275]